jgi:acetolactate synthase-1/2/3 large subunit
VDFTLSFGGPPVLSPDVKFVHIATEEEQTLRWKDPELQAKLLYSKVVADPVETANLLAQHAGPPPTSRRKWTIRVNTAISFRPSSWRSLSSSTPCRLHPAQVGYALQSIFARQPCALIADGGEFGQWMQALLDSPIRITNGPAGAIGAGPPFAAGAKAALGPEVTVIACMGDGSAGFHLAEFDTAVRHKLPYVAVIGNDAMWNAERLIQVREYGQDRQHGCELLPTRYDLVVKALGGHGELVTRVEELGPALERALGSGLPACVNVMIESVAAPMIRMPEP